MVEDPSTVCGVAVASGWDIHERIWACCAAKKTQTITIHMITAAATYGYGYGYEAR